MAGVVAACSAPPGTLPPLPAVGDLRVMTYNVLGAQGDGAVYSEQAGWAARLDQLQPDVVVLQEIQQDDLQAVVALTTSGYTRAAYLAWECDLKPNREGVAVLVRSGVTVLGGGGTHVGDSCVDPTMRRVLVWADLDLAGGPFRVYGTHLTAGGGAAAASRDAQIGRIRDLVAAQDPAGEGRWLLAGDVNTAPGQASYALLAGASGPGTPWVDTFAEEHPVAADPAVCPVVPATDAAGMAALWADPDHVRECGYTAGWPKDDNWLACDLLSFCVSWELRRDSSVRERIDDVWRPAGGPATVARTWVPNRTDGDWAATGAEWFRLSDHLPYVVDVALDDAPARSR